MVLLGIILFIYIYAVPIVPIYTIHILAVASSIYILFYHKYIIEYFKKSKIYIFIIGVLLSITYILILYGFNNFIKAYIIVLENIPIIMAICIYARKKKISLNKIIDLLIIIALVQSFFAVLTYCIRPVQQIFLDILKYVGQDDNNVLQEIATHRMYGYSSNLTFSTPIVQVIIAFMSLQRYIKCRKKRYIVAIPFMIFSAIINARISIVILAAGIVSIIIANLHKKNWKKICVISIVTFAVIMIGIGILLNLNIENENINWIKTGMSEIILFLKGEKVGYFDVIYNKFIAPPQGIEFIFGNGMRELKGSTDVGFINDLWMGGIILDILLYPGYIYIISLIEMKDKNMKKLLRILGVVTFIMMNIKWLATQPNNMLNLYLLIYFIGRIEKEENVKTEEVCN